MESYPVESGLPIDGSVVPSDTTPTPANDSPLPNMERTNSIPSPLNGTEDNPATALMNLEVPHQAVVYVNGRRTSTPGSFRSYVSKNLKPGKNYTYEVKAEIERDGNTLTRTRVIQLAAGDNKTFEMDFGQTETPVTSVTLFVPDNAKVSLGGIPTRASGPMRYFSTSKLQDGQSWKSYQVVVTLERDGKLVQREKTIDVNAGDSVNLRFDFDGDVQVASR